MLICDRSNLLHVIYVCSKKDLNQRRQELLEGISSVLLQMVEKSASELLFDKGAIQLVGAALAKCTGR